MYNRSDSTFTALLPKFHLFIHFNFAHYLYSWTTLVVKGESIVTLFPTNTCQLSLHSLKTQMKQNKGWIIIFILENKFYIDLDFRHRIFEHFFSRKWIISLYKCICKTVKVWSVAALVDTKCSLLPISLISSGSDSDGSGSEKKLPSFVEALKCKLGSLIWLSIILSLYQDLPGSAVWGDEVARCTEVNRHQGRLLEGNLHGFDVERK